MDDVKEVLNSDNSKLTIYSNDWTTIHYLEFENKKDEEYQSKYKNSKFIQVDGADIVCDYSHDGELLSMEILRTTPKYKEELKQWRKENE